jgi:hypothetical protein
MTLQIFRGCMTFDSSCLSHELNAAERFLGGHRGQNLTLKALDP